MLRVLTSLWPFPRMRRLKYEQIRVARRPYASNINLKQSIKAVCTMHNMSISNIIFNAI